MQIATRGMPKLATMFAITAAVIVGLKSAVWAQEFDAGKFEYQMACAACHATDGKGMGPVGALFGAPPADLTFLAKKNGGVFPFYSVYEVIDGRKVVIAHGTRDMPIWGDRYTPSPNRSVGPDASNMFVNPSFDPETVVRMRILAVIDYLSRIQEKN